MGVNTARPHALAGSGARKGRFLGTLSALLNGLYVLLLVEAICAISSHRPVAVPYAVGALVTKFFATQGISQVLIGVGNNERFHARDHFFVLQSTTFRAKGQVDHLVNLANDFGLIPQVQAAYGALRLAPLFLVLVFLSGGWLAAAIALGLVAISAPLYIRAGKNAERLGEEHEIAYSDLELREFQVLSAGQELRGLGASEFAAEEIVALSQREHLSAFSALKAALQSSLVTEFLSGAGIGLVAMVSGFALLGDRTTLFRALLAVFFTNELFGAVRRFGAEFHQSQDAERSLSIFAEITKEAVGNFIWPSFDKLVAREAQPPLDFECGPGKRLLITGPSGSGKTSLLESMLELREPHSGTVRRGSVSVALVTPMEQLFRGSLRENLDPNLLHGDMALLEALAKVGLSTSRFGSLDSRLDANGLGLSSGEQVRFIVARGLVAQASVFVLDDIAGLLDEQSRQQLSNLFVTLRDVCVIEAAIDHPLVTPTTTLDLGR